MRKEYQAEIFKLLRGFPSLKNSFTNRKHERRKFFSPDFAVNSIRILIGTGKFIMKKIIASLLFAVITVLSASSVNFAQTATEDDEVIKVDTTFVSVPVIVSDRNGRYLKGLARKDFTIYQNGVKQNIEFFAPTEEPLNVALLLDTSRSTAPVLDNIKAAAIDFIRQLQPRDRAMIVGFDYEPHFLTQLTSDKNELTQAVEYAEIGEFVGTTLRDAVMETLNGAFAGVKGRKAIILLTDGKDARSRVSVEELMRSTEETDTLVYSVFYETGAGINRNNRRDNEPDDRFPRRRGDVGDNRFPTGDDRDFPDERPRRRPRRERMNDRFPDDVDFGRDFPNRRRQQRAARAGARNAEAENFLQSLSASTAGRYYRSEVGDLNETFNAIIGELRYQYRLGFYPPEGASAGNNEAAREIRVQVSRPDAVVRARRNYRIGTR